MKHKIICGDATEELKKLPENSVDACVTDPPYELNFMNKGWDRSGAAFNVELWQELYRVLKPGAHILVAGIARTHHRMWVALEDAGFEIRDGIYHVFGSGFPKSTDISKSIDKRGEENKKHAALSKELSDYLKHSREKLGLRQKEVATYFPSKTNGLTGCVWNWENGMNIPTMEQWTKLKKILNLIDKKYNDLIERAIIKRIEAEREVIGKKKKAELKEHVFFGDLERAKETGRCIGYGEFDVTAPSTEEAIKWNGWGTALKPAVEIWCLARKPISERNIAANVLRWGCGGINVDKCRISVDNATEPRKKWEEPSAQKEYDVYPVNTQVIPGLRRTSPLAEYSEKGRFPANLILECCCEEDERMKGDIGCIEEYVHSNKKNTSWEMMNSDLKHEIHYKNEQGAIHTNPNCVCRMLDEQSGIIPASARPNSRGNIYKKQLFGLNIGDTPHDVNYIDKGGSSRFFYQAKASQNERWFYCTICKQAYPMKQRDKHIHNAPEKEKYKYLEFHPTQKPQDLICYLMRVITPPNGTVIDPFLGSGTAIIAAEREGFNCVGIDSSPIYCEIAFKRSNGEIIQQKISGNQSTIEKIGF